MAQAGTHHATLPPSREGGIQNPVKRGSAKPGEDGEERPKLSQIDRLRGLVRRLESQTTGPELAEPVRYSTGGAVLDELLPHGGLRPGTLVEWACGPDGSGALLLALTAAASILRHPAAEQRPLAVLSSAADRHPADPYEQFYPPAAISLGIPAESLLVIHQPSKVAAADWLWAFDQALRSGAVAAVYAELGERLDPVVVRRLQLAAEAGGSVGLLVRRGGSAAATERAQTRGNERASGRGTDRNASFADVRWRVTPLPGAGGQVGGRINGRRLRVQLERCRGGVAGGSRVIEVGMSHDPAATGGSAVVIRQVPAHESLSGTEHATTTMVGDLAGRLAHPAVASKPQGTTTGRRNERQPADEQQPRQAG